MVELTVGVMCSCLTSFPGFFRYHLPLFKSIATLFTSTFKSLHLPKRPNQSTNSPNAERLATEEVRVTLGSRVDGRGRFLNSTNLFRADHQSLPLSEADPDPRPELDANPTTRRAYWEELKEAQQSINRPSTYIQSDPTQTNISWSTSGDAELGLSPQPNPPSNLPDCSIVKQSVISRLKPRKLPWRSSEARVGYWNILSLFGTGSASSTTPPRTYSKDASITL